MDVIWFYLIACLPLIVAAGFYVFDKRVILIEAAILAVIGFVVAGIFHYCAIKGMTDDIETFSGKVISAAKVSAWTEAYLKEIYRTEYYTVPVKKTGTRTVGKTSQSYTYTVMERRSREVFSHLEPRTRFHPESFSASDNLNRSFSIDAAKFQYLVNKFGSTRSYLGNRSNSGYRERANHMISGDVNDYAVVNINNFVEPVTQVRSWENKVKASPSVFSYIKVDPNMIGKLYSYPVNDDMFRSDRLLGAASWSTFEWDQMNARLNPEKQVNLIAVNFGVDTDPGLATYLESYWIGGKKNDVVICFGGGNNVSKPTWCHTFSWTENEEYKRNIDSIIITNGIYKDTLKLIEQETAKNFVIKNWSKFDYLTVEIPSSYFIWSLLIQFLVIAAWMLVSLTNSVDKDSLTNQNNSYTRYRR